MKKAFFLVLFVFLFASCATHTPMAPLIPTNNLSPTSTPSLPPTTTPLPLYTVTLQAFHDYNGNGTKDEGEPPLEGILNKTNFGECTTGVDGKCESQLPKGLQNIQIKDNRNVKNYEKMRFILPSVSQILDISKGLSISVHDNLSVNEPLAQGYITWPLRCGEKWTIFAEYDLIPGPGLRTWDKKGYEYSQDHYGTDIAARKGTEIIAGAPGVVRLGKNDKGALFFDIDIPGTNLVLSSGHVEKGILVKNGENVVRGEPIATVGNTGTWIYHIHYALFRGETAFDFYRDPTNPASLGYWTVDNRPQCLYGG